MNNLTESEYYLFIDFKREQIIPVSPDDVTRYTEDNSRAVEHRGSLFSNQELAIATYLRKQIIGFQETKVKIRDGMLSAIQANVKKFDKKENLVDNILQEVQQKWKSNWRNEIVFIDVDKEPIHAERIDEYGKSRSPASFFHVTVKNLHAEISARNCVAYLENYAIISGDIQNTHTKIIPEPVELKWKGMKTQSVLIPPKMSRKFDAIFFYENNPKIARMGINPFIVDLSSHFAKLEGIITVELNYVVYSDNFPPIRCRYMLHVEQLLKQTRFYRNY